ncbi:MAG: nucleotide exchange factor GrpE [Defluviitaleaceae bacterium]|nr:nucleotide exchange factor GrpE [Defluviitaleaceae bacterium]
MAKKNGKECLILWDRWQKLKATIEESMPQQVEEMFMHFKAAMGGQLSSDVARFAHLGSKDEEAYVHLLKMMEVYWAVISHAQQARGDNAEVNALLAGISEVLGSRLKDFEEISGGGANPVSVEKQGIVADACAFMGQALDSLAVQIAGDCENTNRWLEYAVLASQPPKTMFIGQYLEKCYEIYQDSLRQALTSLDDIHSRNDARECTQLLQREWEEIGNIIKVQVPPLEAAKLDKTTEIHKLLTLLRELYQQTGPLVDELQKLLSTPPFRPSPFISQEEFAKILDAVKIKPTTSVNKDCRGFSNALVKQTNGLFARFGTDSAQAAYQMKKIISSNLLLAEEIKASFAKTLDKLSKTTPQEATEAQQLDILKGIIETIGIKIESMADSFVEFNETWQEKIRNFAMAKPEIHEDERKDIAQKVKVAWFAATPESAESIGVFLDACWDEDFCKPARDKNQRQIKSNLDKVEKAALQFKKEVLLYEVCTYEELLTHSVARLRDSAWEVAAEAAKLLDETFKVLETILKKSNITVIRPEAHEIFNAQEHEVLVAEKQEGFKKGEIIKMVTSGYRYGEQIVLRANVIAAR